MSAASSRSGRDLPVDARSGGAERRGRRLDRGHRLRRRRPDAVVGEGDDAGGSRRRRRPGRRAAAPAATCGSSPSGPGDDRQDQREVVDAAGERPELLERRRRSPRTTASAPVRGTRPLVGLRPATPQTWAGWRMLSPVSLPMSNGDAARGDDRGRPAGAAAGRPLEVVRVRRPAVDVVVGLVRPGELGRVRLAEQDPAGRPQPGDDGRVAVRDAVAPADACRRS